MWVPPYLGGALFKNVVQSREAKLQPLHFAVFNEQVERLGSPRNRTTGRSRPWKSSRNRLPSFECCMSKPQQIEFTNQHDLVQYLAASVICRGYWFYVSGHVPDGKDAAAVDAKLIAKYRANLPSSTRWRRKKDGIANVRYLRFGRRFFLFTTKGNHSFFESEGASIRDIRETPLRVGGYSVSLRRDGRDQTTRRVHVRIADKPYRELLASCEHRATRQNADRLAAGLYELPYRGYAPVRSQICRVLRSVNSRRRRAGLAPLPKTCLFFEQPKLSKRVLACGPNEQ